MPSTTCTAHDGTIWPVRDIFTAHTRHEAEGGQPLPPKQIVGMWTPIWRAAASTVALVRNLDRSSIDLDRRHAQLTFTEWVGQTCRQASQRVQRAASMRCFA